MKTVLGIDIGTSSTKALITDYKGRTAGVGNGTYEIAFPEAYHAEQDVLDWWRAVKEAVAEAMRNGKVSGEDITAISFSGQMHGMVALDEEKNPVGPAVIHLDQRTASLLPEIRKKAGSLMAEELLNQPSAGMILSTLYWMKKNRPETYERIRYVVSPKDFIRMKFCGEVGTEPTDAGATLGFSVKNRRWCSQLFRNLGLKEELWAPVHESCEIAGYVTEEAAGETGLSVRTAVIYGAGDSMAALTGNGVIEKGVMACNIGTASQLAVVTDEPVFDSQMRIQTWCHTVKDRWVVQSGTLNGGSTLGWFRNHILESRLPYAALDQGAGTVSAGSEGLLFLPYLAGERTPYNDPCAKGVYFGLSLKHTRDHMVRATMEGILFNLKECLEIIDGMKAPRTMMISSGGAARGETWKQIQADMLDMTVHTTAVEEEACMGAAILAMVGIGIYGSIQEACRETVRMSDRVIEPIQENVRIYREKQQLFHELYERTRDLFPRTV